jgi:hypothetical protein
LAGYSSAVSTVDLIYEKAKSLPGKLQSEALGFVEYLARRRAAQTEAAEWQRLLRDTQTLSAAQRITDDDIAAEIAAYRSGQ